jgi:hypothetical protein
MTFSPLQPPTEFGLWQRVAVIHSIMEQIKSSVGFSAYLAGASSCRWWQWGWCWPSDLGTDRVGQEAVAQGQTPQEQPESVNTSTANLGSRFLLLDNGIGQVAIFMMVGHGGRLFDARSPWSHGSEGSGSLDTHYMRFYISPTANRVANTLFFRVDLIYRTSPKSFNNKK